MVEGPGCKVKGESLKPRIKGQVVVAVRGNKATMKKKSKGTVSKDKMSTKETKNFGVPSVQASVFHQLIGQTVTDIQTLGKEFFMFFQDLDICLRVHFLMSGGFRLNGQKIDGDGGGTADEATFILTLSTDVVTFNLCACDIVQTDESLKKIRELQSLDICYEGFSHQRALILVMSQRGRMLCDVLLDQMILPGVGNIIKNEALFDSRIRPNTKVDELSAEHISHLIKMTRDFSMIFYKCRKTNKSLRPYEKIYNKKVCKLCGHKVTITRMGDDLNRMTSYCPVCQNNQLPHKQQSATPAKNNLLGWVKGATSDAPLPHWSCNVCTLINKGIATVCEVCRSPKQPQEVKPQTNVPKSSHISASGTLNSVAETNKRVLETSSLASENIVQPTKKLKLDVPLNTGTPVSGTNSRPEPEKVKPPVCSKHKTNCFMREVHKKGNNLHRMFWSCPNRACNFFKWADEGFPLCEGHGKRTFLRTVLKEGPNNGRKFFCCPVDKKKQCGFFKWADNY